MTAEDQLKEHLLKTANFTDEEFAYIFSHFKPLSFKKGQTIISPGDKVEVEYFVLSGCLKSFFVNDDDKMFILQFSLPNWWASDYNALVHQVRATITVDCVADTEVLCLRTEDRERLCNELHQFERFFRLRTSRGYVAAHKRLLSFMNNDARGRYDELLSLYPELYNAVPKQLIAAYLGVSRETLSRFNYKKKRGGNGFKPLQTIAA